MEILLEKETSILLEESIKETLETFGIMDIQNIRLVKGPVDFPGKYFVSSIGFVGDYTGLISLYCSGDLSVHIAECMLGSKIDDVDEEVRDALGELTNLVVGTFKSKLGTDKQPFKQSIPAVIDGNDFTTNHFDLKDNKLFACNGGQHTLYVQLTFKNKSK